MYNIQAVGGVHLNKKPMLYAMFSHNITMKINN